MGEETTFAREGHKHHRILAFIPLVYGDSYGFWNRDLGLIVRTLRLMGYDAWLVALYHPEQTPGPDKPVIRATLKELEEPAWWQRQQPDAIIVSTGSAPRLEAIRAAARSLNKPFVEKLDTDGVKSPRVWFGRYFRRDLVDYNFSDPWQKKVKVFFIAITRSLVVYFFPNLLDRKMVDCMSRVPVFAAETPLATARIKRYLRLFEAKPMPRIVTIAHPVNTEQLHWRPGDIKENVVVAVGRWDDAVKGWPLLFEIAQRFLPIQPDWKIVVIGGLPNFSSEENEKIKSLGNGLILTGRLEHQQLAEWNRKAKIYLLTSQWESFNIAAAEALCCGCSVVGPARIASSSYFASFQSGTPSFRRTATDMTDALIAEVDEWGNNMRDPTKISQASLQIFDAKLIAKRFLQLFAEMDQNPAS